MKPSNWKCPDCGHGLLISHGGDYWCTACQQWKDAANVDPMMRDFVRIQILTEAQIERLVSDVNNN